MTKSNQKKISLKREGTLFVISAPSGTGKTTICRKLLKKYDTLKLSVSYTTRLPRKGEDNNIDYTFVTKEKFKKMIDKGEFAEWAMVYGNFYGTSGAKMGTITTSPAKLLIDDYLAFGHNLYPPGMVLQFVISLRLLCLIRQAA